MLNEEVNLLSIFGGKSKPPLKPLPRFYQSGKAHSRFWHFQLGKTLVASLRPGLKPHEGAQGIAALERSQGRIPKGLPIHPVNEPEDRFIINKPDVDGTGRLHGPLIDQDILAEIRPG